MPDVPAIQYDAFISYARKEAGMGAAPLDSALKGESFKVWRDKRNIDPSADFTAEIEKGMEAAQRVILCLTPDCLRDNSFVRREIAYAEILNKPVLVARFAEVRPPISVVNCTWVDFFTDWDDGLARLVAWLRGAEPPESTRSTHTDPFRPYVEALYKQIVADLKFSVFSDDVIPLRSQSAPDAVPTPTLTTRFVTYSVAEPKPQREVARDFDSFPAAWHAYDGRVLLLGEPGAGKTTTLLAFARDAAAARLNDPTQPLPILARIAGWDSLNETPLSEWLSTEIESLVGTPFMASAAPIANLIAQGKTLLLLDGLDELGAERPLDPNKPQQGSYDPRARFLPLIPATGRVLLTSRELEYNQIGLQAGLKGAVVLKPLDDTQMQAYLTGMDDLWAVLASDDTLREAIRTPLLLALFRVAFAELPEEARQLRDLSGGELNDRIWSLFIERRWKHEQARSIEPLPLNVNQITHLLEYAAIKMMGSSIRRDDTRFSIDDLRNFSDNLAYTNYEELLHFARRLHLIKSTGLATRSELIFLTREGDLATETYQFLHSSLRDWYVFGGCCLYLKSDEPHLRLTAASGLGRLRDVRAVESLISALRDSVPLIRQKAGESLGKIRDLRAIDPLVAMIQDADPHVRSGAIHALGLFGDVRVVKPIIVALDDKDNEVRSMAIDALGNLGDSRAVEPLIRFLKDGEPTVRLRAAQALGQLGDSRAIQPIAELLKDFETAYLEPVCGSVALILWSMDTDEARSALKAYGWAETQEAYMLDLRRGESSSE